MNLEKELFGGREGITKQTQLIFTVSCSKFIHRISQIKSGGYSSLFYLILNIEGASVISGPK